MDGKPTETEAATAATLEKPMVDTSDPGEPTRAPEPAAPAPAATLPPADTDDPLLRDIIAALKTVYDPEIPADVYELGLIYSVDVDDDRNVTVTMTLTAPGCPVAGEMPGWVENAVNTVAGIKSTKVTMTFDPPWDMGRMSDEARLALNMF
jgi:FeS assembly SUF system protein